ncbi:uncharacterized protein KY384_000241 [Bacidia gigantensis]|uniref:uncharacterized protein n=1 Tax=Bacidia gigantensis TaxID=2732470 RepID=UPI001D03E6CE|nr:uncharacterized protein KY384_000241 [Bacidia gigantensis]KAG8526248.1 hypothetical protein KY384_000241 [Bacidia gigantensis]
MQNVQEDAAVHQHNHLDFHLLKSRQHLGVRALAPGSPNQDTTTHTDNTPSQDTSPVSQENTSPTQPDTPADQLIDELDKLYGESIGTGSCDDWAGNPDGKVCQKQQPQPSQQPAQNQQQSPAGQTPPNPAPKHVKIVDETVIVVVTKTIGDSPPPSSPASSSSSSSLPPSPAVPPTQQKQDTAPKPAQPQPPVQPKPQPQPQPQPQQAAKQEQPKPQPQPQPQEAPKQEPTKPQPQASPQTQAKPQPTKEQPPADNPSGSGVNTDGLPKDFVDNLDCNDDIFKGLSKLHHDIHRTNHSLPLLVWNDTLFEYAKETAESCIYGHSLAPGGGGYGQNIASGNAPGNISAVLTNGFYNAEIELFKEAIAGEWGTNEPAMNNFEEWGHFTQIVWEGTTSFACYTATCSPPGADPLQCNPATGASYLKNVGCGNGGTKAYNTSGCGGNFLSGQLPTWNKESSAFKATTDA